MSIGIIYRDTDFRYRFAEIQILTSRKVRKAIESFQNKSAGQLKTRTGNHSKKASCGTMFLFFVFLYSAQFELLGNICRKHNLS